MACTINASATNGIVQTADGSGLLKVQSGGVTTNALAWVNFNGNTGVIIRSSYNVGSITKNTTGDYTVNFANALSDANYSTVVGAGIGKTAIGYMTGFPNGASNAPYYSVSTTTSVRFVLAYGSTSSTIDDSAFVNVAIFGN